MVPELKRVHYQRRNGAFAQQAPNIFDWDKVRRGPASVFFSPFFLWAVSCLYLSVLFTLSRSWATPSRRGCT